MGRSNPGDIFMHLYDPATGKKSVLPDNYILFSYKSDDTDVWKGALYQILDKQKSFKTNSYRKSAFLNHGITSIAY